MLLGIHNGNTADMILSHNIQCLSHRTTQRNSDWVIDHTVLCTLYDSHLTGLVLYRHILMYHTDTSLTGNGNSHLTLGNRIHSCRHKRHVQLDVTREMGSQLYHLGQHFRISRNQQDVVECQTVHHNLVVNKRCHIYITFLTSYLLLLTSHLS